MVGYLAHMLHFQVTFLARSPSWNVSLWLSRQRAWEITSACIFGRVIMGCWLHISVIFLVGAFQNPDSEVKLQMVLSPKFYLPIAIHWNKGGRGFCFYSTIKKNVLVGQLTEPKWLYPSGSYATSKTTHKHHNNRAQVLHRVSDQ